MAAMMAAALRLRSATFSSLPLCTTPLATPLLGAFFRFFGRASTTGVLTDHAPPCLISKTNLAFHLYKYV
jgi:hypothetical protein